jgi:type II secretion system protein I
MAFAHPISKIILHGALIMSPSMNKKGFSLIEVLVALVILSIAILATAGLMVTTTKNNSFGNHMTEAATLAQDKMEELLVTDWGSISNNNDVVLVQGSMGMPFTRNWNVADAASLKTITVTVNWNDGTSHTISTVSSMYQLRWREIKD